MPSLNLAVSPQGPIVDVIFGVSAAREAALIAAGQPVPSAVPARLLVDTGASHSCVDDAIVSALGLTPTGFLGVHTPSTQGAPAQMPQYDVRLVIPTTSLSRTFDAIPVTAAAFACQGIDGLLGRDVLKGCLFIYNGEVNFFTLTI